MHVWYVAIPACLEQVQSFQYLTATWHRIAMSCLLRTLHQGYWQELVLHWE